MIKVKRAYEKPKKSDGVRILVDRLWPRGVSKEEADLDLWLKDVAPSDNLRKWFHHDPQKWGEFQKKYKQELKDKEDYLKKIKEIEKDGKTVTLVFAAKDQEHANAIVLSNILQKMNGHYKN